MTRGPDRALRLRFGAWLLAVTALAALGIGRVLPELRIETDITAMLPQVAVDAQIEPAIQRFADQAARQTLFLVGAPDFPRARGAARRFEAALAGSGAFDSVRLALRFDPAVLDQSYGAARLHLLSDRHRALLAAGAGARLGDEALRSLYTPAGLVRARSFAEDPLNLYGDFLIQRVPALGRVQLRDDLLWARSADRDWVLLTATLAGNPFSIALQKKAEPAIVAAIAELQAGDRDVQVLGSGVIRHAAANSARASAEISTFGTVSLLGVILLLTTTFRSLRPLLLSLLALGVGSLGSITACWLLFDRIHLLALVFGSSLIGVAVDYSIHFFADQFRAPGARSGAWSGADAVQHVGAAVLVGMLTTALGYLAFLIPPFPGLRQMAVFSVAGVTGAGLTVLCAYPLLAGSGRQSAPPQALAWMRRLAAIPRPRATPVFAGAVLLLVAFGITRIEFIDDVRALQSAPPELLAQESRLREVLGGGPDTRFFITQGADAEQLLQREEALRARLDERVARGALTGYTALSRALPSQARQAENEAWLARQVYGHEGALAPLFAAVGYPPATLARAQAAFASAQGLRVTPAHWLATPAAESYRALWLDRPAGGPALALSLSGIRDVAAVAAAAEGLPGVHFVDRVADISTVLAHYRRVALVGLVLALVAIGGVLALRYGLKGAARHVLAPLGACALTLATLGLFGVPANLFSVLALLLVLGMGVDYTVFLREGSASRPSTLLAITLAGLATLLSFGMLAASATPFIRSLGLSVLLGVAYTWLLALLISAPSQARSGAARI